MHEAPTHDDAPRGTVLIVDDADATILEISLSGIPGVRVEAVPSALNAVRELRNPQRSVSAIITDIHMPAMDGLQLIRAVRADVGHAHVPIIVVTADTDPDMPRRALEAGANAFFPKPCSPSAVRKMLEELLDVEREP